MENTQKVYQGVNPYEYEELKNYLGTEEHLQVVHTGIDSFAVVITELIGNYNRNGNILTLTLNKTQLSNDSVEDLLGKLGSMVGKEEVTGQVQSTPLMTPMDRKTGLPIVPEPPGSLETGPEQEQNQLSGTKQTEPYLDGTEMAGKSETEPFEENKQEEKKEESSNVVGVIPVVKPTKAKSYDPNAEQSPEVQ